MAERLCWYHNNDMDDRGYASPLHHHEPDENCPACRAGIPTKEVRVVNRKRKETLDSAEGAVLEVLCQHLRHFFTNQLPQMTRGYKELEKKELGDLPEAWLDRPRMVMDMVRQLKREVDLLDLEAQLLERLHFEVETT